jgi:hypothetical protein
MHEVRRGWVKAEMLENLNAEIRGRGGSRRGAETRGRRGVRNYEF